MIVDRIENGIAVIQREDGTFFELSVTELPHDVKEGCVLVQNCEGYALDRLAEKALRQDSKRKTDRLFR